MGRSELRQHIFKMLFLIEFNGKDEMPEQIEFYLDKIEELSDTDREYIVKKHEAIVEKVEEIDEILNTHTTGWKTTRMNKVDLTILRLAVYEIQWDEDVPAGVAINEAVELAKKYSGEEGPSFVNGVLGKIAR